MFQEFPAAQPPLKQVLPLAEESFHVEEFRGVASGCAWHFHPEHQLSVVTHGSGQRIIGDAVCPIEPGEVILLGADLPHVWHYDESSNGVEAVVVHFKEDFAGHDFLNKPEMRAIKLLLARANQGLLAQGTDRERAAELLLSLPSNVGFERTLTLLQVLHLLALAENLKTISSPRIGSGPSVDLERLRCVYAYLDTHLHEHVSREQVAAVAHLNPNAFSRFFRQHTGLTFQDYLNERRVGRACELLMDVSTSITEVAMNCGFSTPTSFARAFKRVKSMSPSAYREQILKLLR